LISFELAVARDGAVPGSLAHGIAGLMTDRPGDHGASRIDGLGKKTLDRLGVHRAIDPFMALPVIPLLKIHRHRPFRRERLQKRAGGGGVTNG